MKKLLRILLTLAVCSAALCVTASAASIWDEPPARVWGAVISNGENGIHLKNNNPDNPMNEVVVRPGEAPVVDAQTGLPMTLEAVKEGDMLYAWIGPAATMSLPPQVFAEAIVGNVPANGQVPELVTIGGGLITVPVDDEGNPKFPLLGDANQENPLEVNDETVYTPWRTRQIVTRKSLIPGTRALVWKNADGVAEKVLVFPYAYQGYLTMMATMHGGLVCVNGNFEYEEGKEMAPQFQCKRAKDGSGLAPLRAIAEAAGYTVSWDKNRGAVVENENGDLVFYVRPGEEVIHTSEGETAISAPCIIEKGVTYLPVMDLAYWLNLFVAV